MTSLSLIGRETVFTSRPVCKSIIPQFDFSTFAICEVILLQVFMERDKCWAECHAKKEWADRISGTGFSGGFLRRQFPELFHQPVMGRQFREVAFAARPTEVEPMLQRNHSNGLSRSHVEGSAEESAA
ncbi:MAG: hypothetical protein NTW32_14370 [Chloroflexi bacterium]|nr:hypothetical protein [Chloroflexota bacterium]